MNLALQLRRGLGGLALTAGATAILAGSTMAATGANPPMRFGARLGPVPIGTASTAVGKLQLPAGNWTVMAKGVIRNKDTSKFALHPVDCQLTVPGGPTDDASMQPFGGTSGSSRQAFLMTTATSLAEPAKAYLTCSTNQAGKIVAENIRMTAFRTGALDLDLVGGDATFGDLGGPTAVMFHEIAGPIGIPGTLGTVASIPVPAGSWAITAKATIQAPTNNNSSVQCKLLANGAYDIERAGVLGVNIPADRQPIALEVVNTFGAPGTAYLLCESSAGNVTKIDDIRIVAYKAGTLTNQHTSDPYFDPKPARPVVNSVWQDGPIAVGKSYKKVAAMSIPAGHWVIVAKGYLTHAVSGVTNASCQLLTSATNDVVKLQLGAGVVEPQPFELIWAGNLTSRITVRLRCNAADGKGQVNWVKLIAYQGASIKTLSLK